MFITFEGVEGSGKSTQIKRLARELKRRGVKVYLTREPGGTVIGTSIRKILLDARNHKLNPLCELLLYYADRAQHVREDILPRLKKGEVVICDRFDDATVAYQGFARGLNKKWLAGLKKIVLENLKPDLTILMDLDVTTGLKRAKGRAQKLAKHKREDRLEREKLDFHKRVRRGYLTLAKGEPKRFYTVSAGRDAGEIHKEILAVVVKKLPLPPLKKRGFLTRELRR